MKELGKISQKKVASDQVSMIEIDDSAAGQRIDNFLLRVCKGVPKSHIYRILRSGEVRVNKGRVDAQYRLAHGDLVRVPPIRIAESQAAVAPPVPTSAHFSVLFEDDHLLVIDKPAGVAVHGGSGVAYGVIEQLRAARPDAKFLELVHRLDRETSGVLMLAKKRAALVDLHEQIRENRMDKRYYACVHGEWASDWGRRRAVKEPLHKYLLPDGERRVRVQPDGLPSHTIFNLINRWPGYALLEAELKTGRTHQIRVHLAHLGLPIIGDAKYGDFALNKALARANAVPGLKRMFLHAYRLKLTHPATRDTLQFDAPLPAECKRFVAQLAELNGEAAPDNPSNSPNNSETATHGPTAI
ncbi:RluA family pseudouridine synthase [Paraburkholderia jirisanensis]